MPVYLYAICERDASLPSGSGFDGQPLRIVRTPELAALVCDYERSRPRLDEDELWQHERVVEALMDAHALLPARFGSVLESDDDVRALLDARADELLAALREVAGSAELGVRAAPTARAASQRPTHENAGVAYFADRLDEQRGLRALADRVDAALAPLAKARRLRMPAAGRTTVSAAYLVPHARIDEFVRCVARLDEQIADGEVLCTGPWPPYSFSEAARA